MGLSKWDYLNFSGTIAETSMAIVGQGGLYLSNVAPSTKCGIALRPNSTYQRGLLRGRARTLLQHYQLAPNQNVGLYSMLDTWNVDPLTQRFYFAGRNRASGWFIAQTTFGFNGGPSTILTSSLLDLPDENQPYGIEFTWWYDAALFGGTSLALYTTTDLAFNNLILRLYIIDKTGFATSSIGEGILYNISVVTVYNYPVIFDNTSIYTA